MLGYLLLLGLGKWEFGVGKFSLCVFLSISLLIVHKNEYRCEALTI